MSVSARLIASMLAGELLAADLIVRISQKPSAAAMCALLRQSNAASARVRALVSRADDLRATDPRASRAAAVEVNTAFAEHLRLTHVIEDEAKRIGLSPLLGEEPS